MGSPIQVRMGLLRTYTAEFGNHMAKMLPTFNSSPAVRLNLSCQDEDAILARLCSMPMGVDNWADAGAPELLAYVYGAKGLRIPPNWQRCFPSNLFEP